MLIICNHARMSYSFVVFIYAYLDIEATSIPHLLTSQRVHCLYIPAGDLLISDDGPTMMGGPYSFKHGQTGDKFALHDAGAWVRSLELSNHRYVLVECLTSAPLSHLVVHMEMESVAVCFRFNQLCFCQILILCCVLVACAAVVSGLPVYLTNWRSLQTLKHWRQTRPIDSWRCWRSLACNR